MTAPVRDYASYYADGAFVRCGGAGPIAVIDPATEETVAQVVPCSLDDLRRATASARTAFGAWSVSPLAERKAALARLAGAIDARADAFAEVLAHEMGCPVWLGKLMQVPMPLRGLELTIAGVDQIVWHEVVGNGIVARVPVGVVAAITPWNFPVHQIVAKVAGAVAAGCTVVLKPSEMAPGAALLFMESVHAAGFPPGVVNMVWGGADIGAALVADRDVDQVSFTGSTAVGKRIMASAAEGLKRVTLELGGKSAAVLLPDADLDAALASVVRLSMANSGQACVSQSRLLVPRTMEDTVGNRVAGLVQAWPLGDPADATTRLGPVANAAQYRQVERMIARALEQGAVVLAGGPGRASGFARGFYCAPTVLGGVTPDMEIANEEVFGPVLAVMAYDDEEHALAISNGTAYGLSGAVWSRDVAHAARFARRMRTGQVVINGAPQNLATPFGGMGQSGHGRENGRFGIEECLTYQSLHGAA